MNERIARWESRTGKHWVELEWNNEFGFSYVSPDACGSLVANTTDEAIAELAPRLEPYAGYFQPDSNKTPMKRVYREDMRVA